MQSAECSVDRTASTLFELDDLTCRFGEHFAFRRLSFSLTQGRVVAVCGHSGSGKSTLLNALGLLRYGSHLTGTVRLQLSCEGQNSEDEQHPPYDYQTISPNGRQRLRSEQFGFVLQSSYLLPTLTGRHNLEMPLIIQGMSITNRQQQVDSLLREIGRQTEHQDLLPVLTRLPREASGGQRQRISILRALVHDPAIVFADEPCASLDPENSGRVMDLLCRWQSGELLHVKRTLESRTLLLVSHDTESIVRHAEQILVLRQGKLVEGKVFQRSDLPDDINSARDELRRLMSHGNTRSDED